LRARKTYWNTDWSINDFSSKVNSKADQYRNGSQNATSITNK
jgi:hypothetical protein